MRITISASTWLTIKLYKNRSLTSFVAAFTLSEMFIHAYDLLFTSFRYVCCRGRRCTLSAAAGLIRLSIAPPIHCYTALLYAVNSCLCIHIRPYMPKLVGS